MGWGGLFGAFRRKPYRIFISYSRKHEQLAHDVYSMLTTQHRPFLDKVSIQVGEDWQQRLRTEIQKSSHVYVLWCIHANESDHVADEIRLALKTNKTIVPVLIGEKTPLPYQLARLHGLMSFSGLCYEDRKSRDSYKWDMHAEGDPVPRISRSIEQGLAESWGNDGARVAGNRRMAAGFAVPLIVYLAYVEVQHIFDVLHMFMKILAVK